MILSLLSGIPLCGCKLLDAPHQNKNISVFPTQKKPTFFKRLSLVDINARSKFHPQWQNAMPTLIGQRTWTNGRGTVLQFIQGPFLPPQGP